MTDSRQTAREKRLQRVPLWMVEYPLESLLAAWGTLNGLQLVLGLTDPASIQALLPFPWNMIWRAGVFIAGLTIAYGIARGRYGTAVPRGLQLIATITATYGVAVLAVNGFVIGIVTSSLMVTIAGLAWFRAWWLRQREILLRNMRKAAGE